MSHLATARKYLNAGLSVLPAILAEKRPRLSEWDTYQGRLPLDHELNGWFSNGAAVCVVTGKVSGNLELIDFDFKAEQFLAWRQLVHAESPKLYARLVVETSQSGGKHIVYRCDSPVPGSLKLAQRNIVAPNKDPIEYRGKSVTPRWNRNTEKFEATITLIETRGEGGCFLCAPSPGYVPERGSLESLPLISESERQILIYAAIALNEVLPPVKNTSTNSTEHGRPGDDYNEHGDFRGLLQQHGWSCVGGGENEYWRRPGKELGQSATIRGKVFYNFSSNAAPFEPDTSYLPFGVYAWLEHDGDFKAAATALRGDANRQNSALNDDYIDSQSNPKSHGGESGEAEVNRAPKLLIRKASELLREFTQLRRMLIEGLLRAGEVMNVIAPPKFGKSWLVLSLALCVAVGLKWLDKFATRQGKVLLVDNELHPETLANRLPKVAMAMGLKPEDYGDRIDIVCLRGKLIDLKVLSHELMHVEPGTYDLIVLDAWYRLQPSGSDENANGDVTQLYNLLESVSDRIGSAFCCIHHTSKGNQSEKSITDVGSGAGAQARAADTHMVMRPHEVDGAVVVGASVRSWAPVVPFVVRYEWPLFSVDEFLDANDLKSARKGKGGFRTTGLNDKSDADDPARFQLLESLRSNPAGMTQSAIRKATGFNGPKFLRLVQPMLTAGLVEYLPKEDTGTKADLYRATVGPVGPDLLQTQTQKPDQLRRHTVGPGSGLAPLGTDPDLVSDAGDSDIPTFEGIPDFNDTNGDFR